MCHINVFSFPSTLFSIFQSSLLAFQHLFSFLIQAKNFHVKNTQLSLALQYGFRSVEMTKKFRFTVIVNLLVVHLAIVMFECSLYLAPLPLLPGYDPLHLGPFPHCIKYHSIFVVLSSLGAKPDPQPFL